MGPVIQGSQHIYLRLRLHDHVNSWKQLEVKTLSRTLISVPPSIIIEFALLTTRKSVTFTDSIVPIFINIAATVLYNTTTFEDE